jgi:hypothetical protein
VSRLPLVLHVTPQLSLGGAGRGLVTLAGNPQGMQARHAILSLVIPEPQAERLAMSAGLRVLPPQTCSDAAVAAADLVHLHFWNTPELFELLRRQLPATRIVAWSHVTGRNAERVLRHIERLRGRASRSVG